MNRCGILPFRFSQLFFFFRVGRSGCEVDSVFPPFKIIQNIGRNAKLTQPHISSGIWTSLLEYLVFESPFAALVIIDELPDNLENVLVKKFQFGVEVLELARYENKVGDRIYRFEPFLADLGQDLAPIDTGEVDTVVVPAQADNAAATFLGEHRWHEIRLHATMRPQLKFIALYQVAPISAITHLAPIESIEPWKDTGKYVVNFSSPAEEIGPIPLVKPGRVKQLQNLRYTTLRPIRSGKDTRRYLVIDQPRDSIGLLRYWTSCIRQDLSIYIF